MTKKIWQLSVFVLLIVASATLQFSFISALPSWFSQINLVLIAVIFTLFFFDFRAALGAALIGGFWLDLFSFNFFGFHLFLLFLTVLLARWIARGWLTNRSLYSLMFLILAATIGYNLIIGSMTYFFRYDSVRFFLWQREFWLTVVAQSAWSELAALLMFNIAGTLTRRFQPFFLENK